MDVIYSIPIKIEVLIGISDERGLLKIISNWGLFDSVTNSEQSRFLEGVSAKDDQNSSACFLNIFARVLARKHGLEHGLETFIC